MPPRERTVSRDGRRVVGAVLSGWSLLLQGCYESLALRQEVPPVATRVELVLNDQGRAALADKLGGSVEKVEGSFVGQRDDAYVLNVYRVKQLGGASATWNGEQVSVASRYAVGFQERRLSKVRTTILAAAIVAGIVTIFFGKSLVGIGGAEEPDPEPDPNPSLRRIPIRP